MHQVRADQMTSYAARLAKVGRLAASDVVARQLDPNARRAVGELWAKRAEGELASARTFSGLHRDCLVADVDVTITQLTQQAANDEQFHAALCVSMAEHYLEAPVAAAAPTADPLRFASCAAEVAPALRFLLHCALSETVAVTYLKECHSEAASPLVRAAVRELLHDEIDHSRVGWAYVAAAVSRPAVRDSFCRELPALLTMVSNAWSEPWTGPVFPLGHGALADSRTRQVTDEALRTLVVPGLARFGITCGTPPL
jgi:hypothetical protein